MESSCQTAWSVQRRFSIHQEPHENLCLTLKPTATTKTTARNIVLLISYAS